jgi:hypothetical protein
MTTAPISLQDLQRRLYVKAKAEKDWRFWGLYVHVAKLETLHAAYAMSPQSPHAILFAEPPARDKHLERELGLQLEPRRRALAGTIMRRGILQDDALATHAYPRVVESRCVLRDRHDADARELPAVDEILQPLLAVAPGDQVWGEGGIMAAAVTIGAQHLSEPRESLASLREREGRGGEPEDLVTGENPVDQRTGLHRQQETSSSGSPRTAQPCDGRPLDEPPVSADSQVRQSTLVSSRSELALSHTGRRG